MVTWTARTSGCTRGPLNFSIQIIKNQVDCEPSVPVYDGGISFAVQLTNSWSSIVSWIVGHRQSRNPTNLENLEGPMLTIVLIIYLCPCNRWSWIRVGTMEKSPGHCLPLWCKADCQTQSTQVLHLIQIFGHCALENSRILQPEIYQVGLNPPTWKV